MIPDFGLYAVYVWTAYGLSALGLLWIWVFVTQKGRK